MGWDVVDTGFQIVLSAEVPEVVEAHLRRRRRRLPRRPRPRPRATSPLGRPPRRPEGAAGDASGARARRGGAGARRWRSLREVGNLSSTSVLLRARRRPRRRRRPAAGQLGMLLAHGAGLLRRAGAAAMVTRDRPATAASSSRWSPPSGCSSCVLLGAQRPARRWRAAASRSGRGHYPRHGGRAARRLPASPAPLEPVLLRARRLAAGRLAGRAGRGAAGHGAALLGGGHARRPLELRVVVVPGEPAVTAGPYRFVRHPNYLAVVVEMAGAAARARRLARPRPCFSARQRRLLARRIRAEELALGRRLGPRTSRARAALRAGRRR